MDYARRVARGASELTNAVKEHGVTLVELLVSLALSAMTLIVAMQAMGTSLHTRSDLRQISSLHDKAQHAMSILQSSVARAGYLGCGGRSADLVSVLRGDLRTMPELNLEQPYAIYRYHAGSVGLGKLPLRTGGISTNAIDGRNGIPVKDLVSGNDLLILRGLSFAASVVVDPVTPGGSIKVDSRRSLTKRSFAAITDCRSIEIFRITGLGSSSGLSLLRRRGGMGKHDNQAAKLESGGAFTSIEGNRTKVFAVETEIFFIAKSRTDEELPALWRKETHRRPLEIIEGVSDLTVKALTDDDGHAIGLRVALSMHGQGRGLEHRLVRFFAFENV